MTSSVIISSQQDQPFADQVRAHLGGAVDTRLVLGSVGEDTVVLLVWSSALEKEAIAAGQAIDVSALIELWSTDRLIVARRDETELPLGMRDLPALSAATGTQSIADAVSAAIAAKSPPALSGTGTPQIKPTKEEEQARLPDEPKEEEAEPADLTKEIRKKKGTPLVPVAIGLLVAAIGGGSLYYFTRSPDTQALMAALEMAKKSNEQLIAARQAGQNAAKELELARQREAEAKASGDQAQIAQLAEETKRREAESAKQAELVKQKEAEAKAAVATAEGAAKRAKESEEQKKVREKAAQEKAAQDKLAQEKAAQGRAAQEKSAQEKAAQEKAAQQQQAKAAAPAPAKAPTPAAAKPAAAPQPKISMAMGAAERMALREEEAARKAAEARAAASPEAKGGDQLAGSSPSLTAPGAPGAAPAAPTLSLYEQGKQAESSGNVKAAVRLYVRAIRAGQYEAAKALGDIFADGKGDVPKDYGESLKYYSMAEKHGIKFERSLSRGGGSDTPLPVAPPPVRAAAEVSQAAAPPAPATATVEKESPSTPLPIVLALFAGLGLGFVLWRWRRGAPQVAIASELEPNAPQSARANQSAANCLFVSYSHRDTEAVEPIVSQIEGMGRQVWMDRTGITGQAGWAGQIVRAIRECKAVVLMASPNSYASDQVVRELYLAMNHKKPIVPIELLPADLPDELQYILAPFQRHALSGNATKDVLGRALAAV